VEALENHLLRQIERSRDFFWHRLRWRALRFHLPEDHPFRLVDVGAGAGLLGDFLSRRVPAASYGFVEPIASLERHLESRFGAEANYRRRDRYHGVEIVTLMDVIEHQEDDREFLADLLSRMESGAVLIVTVPALMSLWSQWDEALGHRRRYDKATFRRSIEGLPVEVRELSYLLPEMVPMGWLRKLRPRRLEGSSELESAEFPDLPKPLNDLLYALGTISLRLRRWWPAGTSLLAVLARR
jgi:hypothetical protein